MKKVSLCLSIALFAMAFQMMAQHHNHANCGVNAIAGAQLKEAMLETRKEMRDFVRPRNAVTYVPVRFFLVAKNNGDDRPSEALALRALCRLNENYLDQEIQFYIKEFKNWNNSTVHSNPGGFGGISAISNQMEYDAINVFIVDEIGEPGVAAYYQLPYGPNGNDWIVAARQFVDDETTLTHEVGHFFTLNHPFFGWEPNPWNDADHGNPVTQFYAPDDFTEVELVDGSNCEFAGDALCDTPADYMFPFPGGGCNLGFDIFDANEDKLEPDFNNFMNYASCSSYYFSDDQKDAISSSLFSSARNYVRPNYTPNTDEIDGNPSIVSPSQNETIDTYNSVYMEWTAVTGADSYLVEVASPAENPRRIITNSNSITLTDLSPDLTYLWRVLAFNESNTCGGYTSQRIFKTGNDQVSDTSDLPNLDEWNVTPNPVKSGFPLLVNVESAEGLEGTVSLVAVTGQLVQQLKNQRFPAGLSSLEINTEGLVQGVYFVTLRTADGLETQRVSIIE